MQRTSVTYVSAIDGLRAIAVLAVIVFHADFFDLLPGGFTGVDLFFVISGYVISQSLAERRHLKFGEYLRDFYRRRCLRILPALLVMLLTSFVLSALFMPQFWLSDQINHTGFAAFVGISNLVLARQGNAYFSPGTELNPYTHTWSLGVEEQFYVVFPVLFFLWLRYRNKTAAVWILLPALAIASLIICAIQTSADTHSAFYLLPGRFWELAAGAMLYQGIEARRGSLRSSGVANALLLCGLGLLTSGFLFATPLYFPFPMAIFTVLGAALTIAGLALPAPEYTPRVPRLLQASWLTYIGRLSFSLYLWHWPVLVFLRWTTGTEFLVVQLFYPLVVWVLAAVSYHWIELPVRTSTGLWLRTPWRTFGLALSALGVVGGSAMWLAHNTEGLSLSKTRDTYTWYAYKHYPREPFNRIKEAWLHERQLFVIGDSHTAAYRTMLNLVALKLGVKVVEYEQGGCGVVTLLDADPVSCTKSREADFEDIEARAKPGDIVFLASLRMPELQDRDWALGQTAIISQMLKEQTPARLAAAKASAEADLARLEAINVHVLIDAPKPLFKSPPNRCSDWFNRMNPVCSQGMTVGRELLLRLREAQMKLLAVLTREHPGLTVWDPFPLLCPGTQCSAFDPLGKPLFFDSNHLSGNGNRVLEPSFTQVLLHIWDQS